MARPNRLDIIKNFINTRKAREKEVLKLLGITKREAQILFEGLSTLTTDSKLEIAGFIGIGRKFTNFPGPYINRMKKVGLVTYGTKRGSWLLTDEAINKFSELGKKAELPARKRPKTKVAKQRSRPIDSTESPKEAAKEPDRPESVLDFEGLSLNGVNEKTTLGQLKKIIDNKNKDHEAEIERLNAEIDRVRSEQAKYRHLLTQLGL